MWSPARVVLVVSALGLVTLANGFTAATAESDLSELEGTFWRLDRFDGFSDDPSKVIVQIDKAWIELSAPCFSVLYGYCPRSRANQLRA